MFELAILFLVLYLAWNIGGNDVANSMGTVYGSKTLSLRNALLLAAILEFGGAVLLGQNVTKTISSGVIGAGGGAAVALATALWITLAAFKKLPISVTQATIGSLIGFGIVSLSAVNWNNIYVFATAWIVSPLFSLILAFAVFILLKELFGKKIKNLIQYERMQEKFAVLQIVSAGLLCFAHGANDVAAAIGIAGVATWGMPFLQILGGSVMALGIITIGGRTIETIGEGITFLTPLSGFAAQIASALTILFFVMLSVPVSTTHIVLGSLVGIGLINKINWCTLGKVVLFGFLTVPVTALLAAFFSFL